MCWAQVSLSLTEDKVDSEEIDSARGSESSQRCGRESQRECGFVLF